MRYAIDVVFLDRAGRVARAARQVVPGRMIPFVRGAARAIELPAGTLDRVEIAEGDELWLVAPETLLP